MTKTIKLWLVAFLLSLLVAIGVYHSVKPLPPGIARETPARTLQDPQWFEDLTWRDQDGNLQMDHEIFDEILRLVNQAERLIVVDMFLFNDSAPGNDYRTLAEQLTQALIARKQTVPGIQVVVITDPINTFYGGARSPFLDRLRDAGIPAVETSLSPLRDSNPLWSSIWRLCCQWMGNTTDSGWLPNMFGEGEVTLRSYLALPNFKANHRKTLIVDEGNDWRGLITSANPHAGSSRHSNVAISFTGPAVFDLLQAEQAVLEMSRKPWVAPPLPAATIPAVDEPTVKGQILTEEDIREGALAMLQTAVPGSQIDLAMFYVSHREIINELVAAHERGVAVRVLLDLNQNAFGRDKSGIPNQPVAAELNRAGIEVRWCNTFGEQCHSKLMIRQDPDDEWQLMLGSANFTRRNLDSLNLEANIRVWGGTGDPLIQEATDFFDYHWRGNPGRPLSLPYGANADPSILAYWQYRLMEATGLSTF